MTTKKILCLLLCICLCFTLLSGPWRAEAEAAGGVASIVLAIVGTFVVSAGFSFVTKGEFQTATEAFMTSDAARYVTNITDYVSDIFTLNNATNIYDLAPIVTSGWFADFWNSIYDFFGGGDITVDLGGIPAPPDGYAYYNEHLLPFLTKTNLKDFILYKYADNTYYHYCFSRVTYSTSPWLKTVTYPPYNSYIQFNGSYSLYTYTSGDTNWVYNTSKSNVSGGASVNYGDVFSSESQFELVWSNFNMHHGENYNVDTSNIVWFKSDPITEGEENIDVIGVIEDTSIYPPDVYTGWVDKASEGSIDWALDSSSVYQDVTSSDTTSSMTSTQSGVLTDTGVKVDTIEKTMGEYAVSGLTSLFPFCIPFDVYNFFAVLTAEREAPKFEFNLSFGDLGSYPVAVDLSDWETVAAILRTVELLGFCIGLALATSKLIKW